MRRRAQNNLRLLVVDRDFTSEDYETLLELDADIIRDGAAPEQIDRLPLRVVQANEIVERSSVSSASSSPSSPTASQTTSLECGVCLEPIVVNDVVRTLPCLHQFHSACSDRWLVQSATCPICKTRIF
jgi:E3 ubiquitin-protein ligase SDIR1